MMGPSGSGKTTLLSILGCILSPTEGKLTLAGFKTQNMSKEQLANLRRKHVGFVFQSYNLVPTLSGGRERHAGARPPRYQRSGRLRPSRRRARSRRPWPSHQRHAVEDVGRRKATRFDRPRPCRVALGHSGRRADGGARCQKRHGGDGIARQGCSGHAPRRSRRHPRPPHAAICRPHHNDRRRADCGLGAAQGFRQGGRRWPLIRRWSSIPAHETASGGLQPVPRANGRAFNPTGHLDREGHLCRMRPNSPIPNWNN